MFKFKVENFNDCNALIYYKNLNDCESYKYKDLILEADKVVSLIEGIKDSNQNLIFGIFVEEKLIAVPLVLG